MFAHQRPETRHDPFQVVAIGDAAVTSLPSGRDRWLRQKTAHMFVFGLAHVPANGGFIEWDALSIERFDRALTGAALPKSTMVPAQSKMTRSKRSFRLMLFLRD